MNLGEMKAYIGSLVDDKAYAYFTEPELTRFINQSAKETQKRLIQSGNNWYVKKDETIVTVVGQQFYNFPSDFMKLNRMELVTDINTNSEVSLTLNSITLNQQDAFSKSAATPVGFFDMKSTFGLVPKPDSVKTLRMYYTYRIVEVSSNSDIVDVPEEFHTYVCHLAAIQCFLKDNRDASLLMRWTSEVERNLDKDAEQRLQDQANKVVLTSEDSFGLTF